MDDSSLVVRPLGLRRLVAADGLVAVAYLLVLIGTPSGLVVREGGLSGPAVALLAGAVLPVALRRVWPVPVFAVSLGLSLAALLLGVSSEPLAAAAFALYQVALTAAGPRRLPTVTVGMVSVTGLFLVTAVGPAQPTSGWVGPALVGAGFLGVSWTVGRAVRERRSYAERSARRLAERAVTEERLRIARELHDVVAHGMSVIAVKSGVTAHLLSDREPRDDLEREARDALQVIETTSRAALTEMRHLLDVLRPDDPAPAAPGHATTGPATLGPATLGLATSGLATTGRAVTGHATPGQTATGHATVAATSGPTTSGLATSGPATPGPATSGPATSGPATPGHATPGHAALSGAVLGGGVGMELAPVPGLSGIEGLAERARLAGVDVRLRMACGDPLPEGVELAAYRIVQEALTNVVRHASPARCRVTLRTDGGELGVEVVDDGPGVRVLPTPPGGGHGLIGMRERVAAYGGTLRTGPETAGGFAVRASLPYELASGGGAA